MEHLLRSLHASIQAENWYAALCVSLTLPDICGRIENPGEKSSQTRFAAWFDTYIRRSYTHRNGPQLHERTFLTGNDCYALRCAFLHEGRDDITEQRAREAVDRFHFIVPPPGFTIHCNMINARLQLQVDIFCHDIAQGVERWLTDARTDERKRAAIAAGLLIHLPDPGGGIRI